MEDYVRVTEDNTLKILTLTLKGYKRLALSNIDYIKITPVEKIQLILGTNGSGKSSLLKEWSPLPAIAAEFQTPGYKIVELTHHNIQYRIENNFTTNGVEYSIRKAGVELNQSIKSITVFKEIIRQEFGLTTEIHSVLIGDTKFTTMSVGERRQWFTRLSKTDYTFALSFYQGLKDGYRDIQGGIKLNQARLVQETDKLLTPQEELRYRDLILSTRQLLVDLFSAKSTSHSVNETLTDIAKIDLAILDYSKKIGHITATYTGVERKFNSHRSVSEVIAQTSANIKYLTAKTEDMCSNITRCEKTISLVSNSGVSEYNDIDITLDATNLKIAELTKTLHYPFKLDDPGTALKALLTVTDNLEDISCTIESNEERLYSRERLIDTESKILTAEQSIISIEATLAKLNIKKTELDHIQTHNKLECPKCAHMWVQNYNPQLHLAVIEKITATEIQLTESHQTLSDLKTYRENALLYIGLLKRYMDITNHWTILKPFWEHLNTNSILIKSPKALGTHIYHLKNDLLVCLQLEELVKTQSTLLDLKTRLTETNELDIKTLKSQITDMNEQLYQLNTELQDSKATLGSLEDMQLSLNSLDELTATLELSLRNRNYKTTQLLEELKSGVLTDIINTTQQELNKIESIITRIDSQKNIVIDIEAQLASYIAEGESYKLAIKELSPTDGVIAKGLTGSINNVINEINIIIAMIWTYTLELMPVSIIEADDSVDLDYKFPLLVGDSKPVPDVSKGSSAMMEIVDTAFRITVMRNLNLSEWPLYLDEFAARFDSAHKISAHNAINDLARSSDYSQILIISHNDRSYGSLTNSDMIVLSEANIVLHENSMMNRTVSLHQ